MARSTNPATGDLSRLAEWFFNGLPIDERFDKYNAEAAKNGAIFTNEGAHTITYDHKSPWVEYVEGAVAAVADDYRETNESPFKNALHNDMGIFLQDCMMANDMEEAVINKTEWVRFQWFTLSLRQAPVTT